MGLLYMTYTWKITEGTKTWTESALTNTLDHRMKWAEKHTSQISDKVQMTDYRQLMLQFMALVADPPPPGEFYDDFYR
jgi:hypothetical protein